MRGTVIVLLAALIALCLSTVGGPAFAQPDGIDHYLVYEVAKVPFSESVTLVDQFGGSDVLLQTLLYFANPVSKNSEPIFDTQLHYTWYRFTEGNPTRSVTLSNQFGTQEWTVGNAGWLAVPARKNETGPPISANHYKCYSAGGAFTQRTVVLKDQFGTAQTIVLKPVLFCNPAEKTHSGRTYPIVNDEAHLACYEIQYFSVAVPSVLAQDQFLTGDLQIGLASWLCVPSTKLFPIPTEESTWGRIKSLYGE